MKKILLKQNCEHMTIYTVSFLFIAELPTHVVFPSYVPQYGVTVCQLHLAICVVG